MSNSFYVYSTAKTFSAAKAKRISKAIKALDRDMEFIGPMNIPGNQTRGWIVRPDDGFNSSNVQREINQRAAFLVMSIIGA